MSQRPGRVKDYTKPFLVMAFVVVFTGLFLLWAAFGYAVSLVTSLFLHIALGLIPKRG
ncbi:hypothetical protein [Litoreibacter arenae]|uniref:Uncharacterized protein n=1 Tax=Litoreibacter arenae DSM 19593 TaxID=1123360 RepID=S9QMP6_9RHOB|nr:hypothetical protein [Litoreibacter arenae]EPX80873.1 hypothetical protein thalar_01095 [Litoreibacter arenae DSM 19593]